MKDDRSSPYKKGCKPLDIDKPRKIRSDKFASVKEISRALSDYERKVISENRGRSCPKCRLHPCANYVYFRCKGRK